VSCPLAITTGVNNYPLISKPDQTKVKALLIFGDSTREVA